MSTDLATEVDLEIWDCIFQSKLEELQRPERWTLGQHDNLEPGPGWRQYALHAFASFRCWVCDRTWSSARVRMIFHIKRAPCPGGENFVDMRIFKQACQMCNTAQLEEPEFTIENINVAMDRLLTRILLKCYGEDVSDRPVLAFTTDGRKDGCHDNDNCEACRLGLCKMKPQLEKQDGHPSLSQGSNVDNKRPMWRLIGYHNLNERSSFQDERAAGEEATQDISEPTQQNQETRDSSIHPQDIISCQLEKQDGHPSLSQGSNVDNKRPMWRLIGYHNLNERSSFQDERAAGEEATQDIWGPTQQNQETRDPSIHPQNIISGQLEKQDGRPSLSHGSNVDNKRPMWRLIGHHNLNERSSFQDEWAAWEEATQDIWGPTQQNQETCDSSIHPQNIISGQSEHETSETQSSRNRWKISCCPCVLL